MKTVFLFDLDGTLLDTAPDLIETLNLQLKKYNKPLVSFNEVRNFCAHGSKGLITHAFAIDDQHEDYNRLRNEYLEMYFENIFKHTTFFDGVLETLTWIANQNYRWGIVTNKPTDLTYELLKYIEFPKAPNIILCADTLAQRKPDPAPILYAMVQLKCSKAETLFVGDSTSDIYASKAAGVDMLYVDYGYEMLENIEHAVRVSHSTLLTLCQQID